MPWNPDIYNQFKDIRFKPFFDLMSLISDKNLDNAIDVGCGTGEQTVILSKHFANTNFVGIDSSAEMLEKSSHLQTEHLKFEQQTIEDFAQGIQTYDLIFSNAALQWSDTHKELFQKIISKLNRNGQLAIQMPVQTENTLNQILLKMVQEPNYAQQLNGFVRHSPVLSIDDYTQLLFDNGLTDINISLKVYPIIASSATELFNFISGSALVPYFERLTDTERIAFKEDFVNRIHMHYNKFPAIYPFKRILMYGTKND